MYYWNSWYAGWGWFLWFGIFFLFFSTVGNWGYTYQAHRKFLGRNSKNALDLLNERYARGEITEGEYLQVKSHFFNETEGRSPKDKKEFRQGKLQTS